MINLLFSLLVVVFSCTVIKRMKSSVHTICDCTAVERIRSPFFHFFLKDLVKRKIFLFVCIAGILFCSAITNASHFSRCQYRMHHENTCHCSCCDNPSLDVYFYSDFSYYIYRQFLLFTLVLLYFPQNSFRAFSNPWITDPTKHWWFCPFHTKWYPPFVVMILYV